MLMDDTEEYKQPNYLKKKSNYYNGYKKIKTKTKSETAVPSVTQVLQYIQKHNKLIK